MPPFLPRKRLRTTSPEAGPSKVTPKASKAKSSTSATPRKRTVFDDLDAGTGTKRTADHNKAVLEKLTATDDESSLSSVSEDEFEDIPGAKRQANDESDDEEEDIEFEDVETYTAPRQEGPPPSGDLELTLTKDTRISLTNPLGTKKGPTKIERQIRISTHQMHTQMLMFHNAIRNAWICNKELQEILVNQLTPGVIESIEKWRRRSGLHPKEKESPRAATEKGKGKGKAKGKNIKGKQVESRNQRDWGEKAAEMLDNIDVRKGSKDPLFKLMEVLIAFWKQRFRITAPGLRKLGYMSLQTLDEETKSFERDDHDPERHGERIRDVEEFKECAKAMEGSRDVGAQLFTALLRGIGLEARLVCSLQPAGFGWSQYEEASEKNPRCIKRTKTQGTRNSPDSSEDSPSEEEKPITRKGRQKATSKSSKSVKAASKSSRQSLRGNRDEPIDLSNSEHDSVPESDDGSVVDVAPAKKRPLPSLPYDKDLVVPNYWSEVLSPISNTYTPVDAMILRFCAENQAVYEKFLPPQKSEKAKHNISYIIGHSPDGTAKDVTTRYLKGRMWPGRTKGYRLPPEKVPVYDRKGKVKRYEINDWFKKVMSGYVRGTKKCPRTEIDDHEEATDLRPAKREKKVVEEGKESLQSYKASAEFVLERHLKREEALLPTAKHAKMFTVKGKGDTNTQEKVFLRKDVVNCKSMETWHKEGRAPRPGEQPLKRVPYRAATTNRRRELAEAEQATGGKVLQGLFSREQTDCIIPPPIENGIIPKNSFGNIDLYVDSMLPEGAVHLPWRSTAKICKRLGIDYAEAVTGFEFGHRMAVPVITGVVVAEEHYEAMMEEWQKDEAERVRKEDEKRKKAAVNMWRRMLMGMRIIERVREEYGEDGGNEIDAFNPFNNKKISRDEDKTIETQQTAMAQQEEDAAGGFLPVGHDEEEPEDRHASSFFPVAADDMGDDQEDDAGGFILENHGAATQQAYATPQSFEFSNKAGLSRPQEISNKNEDEDEDEDEDEEMPDAGPEVVALQRKGRGKPASSANKISKSKPQSTAVTKRKTPAKRSAVPQTAPASAKRKLQIEDTDDELSQLSSADIDTDADNKEPPKKAARTPAKRTSKVRPASASKAVPAPRKTPRRAAARKSETALRSKYFEHSTDDDDEE